MSKKIKKLQKRIDYHFEELGRLVNKLERLKCKERGIVESKGTYSVTVRRIAAPPEGDIESGVIFPDFIEDK